MKMTMHFVVAAEIEWPDGQPEAATIGALSATHHPAQFMATGGPMLPAVKVDLPPIVMAQGWRTVLTPIVTDGAREIERLRGGG